jgi:hypothetical protein
MERELEENRDRLRDLNKYWNSKSKLVKQFGYAGSTVEGKDVEKTVSASDFQLRQLLKENTGLRWGVGDMTVTDTDLSISKRAIDRLSKDMSKGDMAMNQVYQMTQVPFMVHGRLPSSKRWLQKINEAKSFERVRTDNLAEDMVRISRYLKAALVDIEKPKTLSDKILKKSPAFELIREFERKIQSTENNKLRIEYYRELNKKLEDPELGGARVINDFHNLMEKGDKGAHDLIKSRINSETKENPRINQNTINAYKEARKMLGKEKDGKFTGLAGMLIRAIEMTQKTAIKTHGGLSVEYTNKNISQLKKKAETINNRELNSLLKMLDTEITNIKMAASEGTYFPHQIFNKISQVRRYLEGPDTLLSSERAFQQEKLSKMNAILSETKGLSSMDNIKGRKDVLEAMWSKDPISSLDLYINEALTFNRNAYMKDSYVDAIKLLGHDPRVNGKDTPHFIKGMRDYMEMQYVRSTEGFQGRPDWFNSSIRTVAGLQVMTTMGFVVLGAARNFFSGYYFHASQGMGVIRQAKNTISGDDKFKLLLSRYEKEAGFAFQSQALSEAAAEGLAPLKGTDTRKIDWRIEDNGDMTLLYDGKTPKGEMAEKLLSKGVQTSLVFHRLGENALRKNIWRIGFAAEYNRLQNDNLFKDKHQENWREEAGKHAKGLADEAVNTFAFEYSIVNKAPIISGTAPRLGENGQPQMSARDYATGAGSLIFQFMHYPMSFAAHQAKSLRGTVDGLMSGAGLDSPGGKNLLGLAGVYLTVSMLGILSNTDLHRMLPNDTKERAEDIFKSLTPPKGKEKQYGIISQLTGPTVSRALFWANYAGMMNMSDNAISRALLGYNDFASMTKDEKEMAKWNNFSVEGTKLMKKTIPNIRRGAGLPIIAQQEFSLYPTEYTKTWRKGINDRVREHTGLQPFPRKKIKAKKPKPRKQFLLGDTSKNKGLLGLSQLITNRKGI